MFSNLSVPTLCGSWGGVLVRVWLVLVAGMLTTAAGAESAVEAMVQDEAGQDESMAQEDTEQMAETPRVGWIELNGALRNAPLPFAWVTEEEAGDSLRVLLEQIALVRDDASYRGVVVFLDQPQLSLTQCTAIADALRQVSEAGKTVMTFAEVYDLRGYLIASAADMVLLQKKGSVELSALAVEEMYLAGMFEKIGVQPDLLQVGKYKGADETMMNSKPSEAWDENFDALLDGLYEQSLARIVEGRGLGRDEVEKLFGESWAMTDQQLLQANVVDQLVDRDLLGATEPSFGEEFEWDSTLGVGESELDTSNPFALFSLLFQSPEVQTDRPTLAVIHADGPIMSGDSSVGDGFLSEESIGSRTVVAALEEALLDENIKGAILRLDSPGGSALASEIIWQALRELGKEKPVMAVVGDMAASGGYYIASGADQIYVQPHSILGSIGVVGGKITLGGLYEWAGVNVVRRSRGAGGDLFNSVEPFTDTQRETVRKALTTVYEQFVDRVKVGRGDRLPEVAKVAEGRLFVGADCVENGMADKIGGLEQALEDLADRLQLEAGSYDVVNLPAAVSLGDYLDSLLGVQSPAVGAAAAGSRLGGVGWAGLGRPEAAGMLQGVRQVLGPVAWRSVSRSLQGMMQLQHEPVLLLMPQAIVVR